MKKLYLLATAFLTVILGMIFSLQPVAAAENLGVGSTTPYISITNLFNGSQVSGLVSINADASSSAGIIGVDFQVDGVSIASASAYPYSVVWDASSFIAGTWHSIVATVYDYAGKFASAAVTVQITPTPTPSPTPTPTPTPSPSPTPSPTPTPTPTPTPIPVPTVSITNPVNGGTVKKGVATTITAQALDSQGITKVEFYVNNLLTCTDTTSSYNCNWKVPSRNRVSYTLTAKAYNLAGNIASSSITVTSR